MALPFCELSHSNSARELSLRHTLRPARFYISGIGGGVIGLFNNIFGQNISVSPLALAFLVGYAADMFLSLLDATTQNLGKAKSGS